MRERIIDAVASAAGFAVMVALTALGILYIFTHLYQPTVGALGSVEFFGAAAILAAGVLARTAVLAVLVYWTRGRSAIEWCSPSACRSIADWLGSSWCFAGAGGRQQGMRVLGLGIALYGDHGQGVCHG